MKGRAQVIYEAVHDPCRRSGTWAVGPLTLYVGRQRDRRSHVIRDRGFLDIKVRRYYAGICWR